MRRSFAALVVLGCAGCWPWSAPPTDDPCDADRHGCEDGMLDVDGTCELSDELVVELGQGERAFEPLPDGVLPEIHHGAQGGQHVFLGVRVANAALARYEELRVEFQFFAPEDCPAPEDDDLLQRCTGQSLGGRDVVLGEVVPLAVTDTGAVEEFGIVVYADGLPPGGVIEASVEDPCGQTGIARHRF